MGNMATSLVVILCCLLGFGLCGDKPICRQDDPQKFIYRCGDCEDEPEDNTPSNIVTESGKMCRQNWCFTPHDRPKVHFENACTCKGEFYDYPFLPWCVNTDGVMEYYSSTTDNKLPKVKPDLNGKCSKKLLPGFAEEVRKLREKYKKDAMDAKRETFNNLDPKITMNSKVAMQDFKNGKSNYIALGIDIPYPQNNQGAMKLLGDPKETSIILYLNYTTFRIDDLMDLIRTEEVMWHFFKWDGGPSDRIRNVILYTFSDTAPMLIKMKMSTWRTQLQNIAKDYYELNPNLIEAGSADVAKLRDPSFDRDKWVAEKIKEDDSSYVRVSGGK